MLLYLWRWIEKKLGAKIGALHFMGDMRKKTRGRYQKNGRWFGTAGVVLSSLVSEKGALVKYTI